MTELERAIAERRPPQKGYIHAVAYSLDLLANVVFRPVLRVLGVVPAGYTGETISSALGKSYSTDYLIEPCRWCRFFCQHLLTPADNALMWMLRKERRAEDHCRESINRRYGMPPRTHPEGFSPGD